MERYEEAANSERRKQIMIQKVLMIGFAGALGTLARYGMAGAVQRLAGTSFPWGTVVVNIAGCFLAGLLWSLLDKKIHLDHGLRLALFIGFMGAFTTFSTFILETGHLVRQDAWLHAGANLMLQNVIGLCSLAVGLSLGKSV
jgi:fluoride exporter